MDRQRQLVGITLACCLLAAIPPAWGISATTPTTTTTTTADLPQGAHPGIDPMDITSTSTSNRNLQATQDARSAIFNGAEVPAWRGRFDTVYGRSYFVPSQLSNNCKAATQNCSMIPGTKYPYEQYILDPTAPTNRPVLKVTYPAGSWSPQSPNPGGTLFYAFPYKWDPNAAQDPLSTVGVTMEYEVYFPAGFDFVKGGKLPGMSGGKNNGRGCGGGADPSDCFSYRIMFRRSGWGEAYLYVPEGMQDPSFCALPVCSGTSVQPCTVCDYATGVSYYRGAFVFQTGTWTKLRLSMTLNTPNVTDGKLTLDVNGQRVIDSRTMNWRQYGNIFVEGVTFATWFGGSDSTWSPPVDQYTLFRNFKVYYDAVGENMARTTVQGPEMIPPPGWKGPVNIITDLAKDEPPY